MKKQNKYSRCPICNKTKNVISDGISSACGTVSESGSSGESESFFYCTKCFVDFNVRIRYVKHNTDKRIGMNGWTGIRG